MTAPPPAVWLAVAALGLEVGMRCLFWSLKTVAWTSTRWVLIGSGIVSLTIGAGAVRHLVLGTSGTAFSVAIALVFGFCLILVGCCQTYEPRSYTTTALAIIARLLLCYLIAAAILAT